MRCPSCGAVVSSAFCEYCGAKMPVERVETQTIAAENVVVNNYYYNGETAPEAPQAQPQLSRASRPSTNSAASFAYSVSYASPKSRLLALLLCFFLGWFGAHRFYAGRYLLGVVYLFTFGLLGVGWFVDLILIILGRMRDRNGLPITAW